MIYSDVLKGGSSGKCVESGDVDSLLVKCVAKKKNRSCLQKAKLSDKEIDLIDNGLPVNAKIPRVKE